MELIEMSDAQILYEGVQWAVIIGINLILMLFAYWLVDIATLMKSRYKRWATFALAIACAGMGLWRMVAIVIYFDSFTARLAIPISAALTWVVIGVVGYAAHRYIKGVYYRSSVSTENWELTEAVNEEVVRPLLRGEDVSQETIQHHKAASLAYAAKHR